MAHPWFFIRCPTCERFWGERGRFPPDEIVTPCLLCRRNVVIRFGFDGAGRLAIEGVSDEATGQPGGWSPLLDRRVHRTEVN